MTDRESDKLLAKVTVIMCELAIIIGILFTIAITN